MAAIFSGVFLDKDLSLDAGYFLFLVRCFSSGSASLPNRGMGEFPRLLAQQLSPQSLRLNCSVSRMSDKSVTLTTGENIKACAVVQAYPDDSVTYRSVSTYYFKVGQALDWERWLVLVPPHLGLSINHLAIVSEVAKGYSGDGSQLLSATVLGETQLNLDQIQQEINQVAGRDCKLQHISTTFVKKALPKTKGESRSNAVKDGMYQCGDWLSTPSINGSLRSGRLAAEAILAALS